jgi:hypothetical protein
VRAVGADPFASSARRYRSTASRTGSGCEASRKVVRFAYPPLRRYTSERGAVPMCTALTAG